jgi:hypothetical protein
MWVIAVLLSRAVFMTPLQITWYKEAPNDLCKEILCFVVSSAAPFYRSVSFCLIRQQKSDAQKQIAEISHTVTLLSIVNVYKFMKRAGRNNLVSLLQI